MEAEASPAVFLIFEAGQILCLTLQKVYVSSIIKRSLFHLYVEEDDSEDDDSEDVGSEEDDSEDEDEEEASKLRKFGKIRYSHY